MNKNNILRKIQHLMKSKYFCNNIPIRFSNAIEIWKDEIDNDLIRDFINWDYPDNLITNELSKSKEFIREGIPEKFLGSLCILFEITDKLNIEIIKLALNKYVKLVSAIQKLAKEKGELFYVNYYEDEYEKSELCIDSFFKLISERLAPNELKEVENIIDNNLEVFCEFVEREGYYLKDYCFKTPVFINQYISDVFKFSDEFLIKNKNYLTIISLMSNDKYNINSQRIILREILPCFLQKMAEFKTQHKIEHDFSLTEDEIDLILLQRSLI